ncbi:MAG TPA: choice-of-anchor D domain-containing protein, partial [Terriglobales bacterium]|nr:choice-of-anchor D domain-containing protein [Terriglobales bacterium]
SGAHISLGAATLNFGSVAVGTTKSLPASLSASGAKVTVTGATTNSPEFGLSGLKFPFTIPAGQRVSFSIKFAPKMSGTAYGKITFNSNAANSPVAETLTGTGTTSSQHAVSLSWNRSTSTVAHYNVYRSGTSGGPYTRIASVPGTFYTDTSVQAGRSYYYVTTAVSSSGKESSHSNQVHALIP